MFLLIGNVKYPVRNKGNTFHSPARAHNVAEEQYWSETSEIMAINGAGPCLNLRFRWYAIMHTYGVQSMRDSYRLQLTPYAQTPNTVVMIVPGSHLADWATAYSFFRNMLLSAAILKHLMPLLNAYSLHMNTRKLYWPFCADLFVLCCCAETLSSLIRYQRSDPITKSRKFAASFIQRHTYSTVL